MNAFWSLTMYDPDSYLVANAIDRYALGDRSGLTYADDGSLTLYIQRDKPDASTEANWLPAPSEGAFKVALRLYSPKPEVAAGNLAATTDPTRRLRPGTLRAGLSLPPACRGRDPAQAECWIPCKGAVAGGSWTCARQRTLGTRR